MAVKNSYLVLFVHYIDSIFGRRAKLSCFIYNISHENRDKSPPSECKDICIAQYPEQASKAAHPPSHFWHHSTQIGKRQKSSMHASALIFKIIAHSPNVEVKNYLHLYQPLDIQCPYTLIWRWRWIHKVSATIVPGFCSNYHDKNIEQVLVRVFISVKSRMRITYRPRPTSSSHEDEASPPPLDTYL